MKIEFFGAYNKYYAEKDALRFEGDREDMNPFGKAFEEISRTLGFFIPVWILTISELGIRTVTQKWE